MPGLAQIDESRVLVFKRCLPLGNIDCAPTLAMNKPAGKNVTRPPLDRFIGGKLQTIAASFVGIGAPRLITIMHIAKSHG